MEFEVNNGSMIRLGSQLTDWRPRRTIVLCSWSAEELIPEIKIRLDNLESGSDYQAFAYFSGIPSTDFGYSVFNLVNLN